MSITHTISGMTMIVTTAIIITMIITIVTTAGDRGYGQSPYYDSGLQRDVYSLGGIPRPMWNFLSRDDLSEEMGCSLASAV